MPNTPEELYRAITQRFQLTGMPLHPFEEDDLRRRVGLQPADRIGDRLNNFLHQYGPGDRERYQSLVEEFLQREREAHTPILRPQTLPAEQPEDQPAEAPPQPLFVQLYNHLRRQPENMGQLTPERIRDTWDAIIRAPFNPKVPTAQQTAILLVQSPDIKSQCLTPDEQVQFSNLVARANLALQQKLAPANPVGKKLQAAIQTQLNYGG